MLQLFPTREIIFSLGAFEVRWYGLMYVLGFCLAIYLLPRLQKYRQLNYSQNTWLEIITWSAVGVLAGGRLGYVLLYDPSLLKNLGEAVAIWDGGMSAHGGMVGVAVVLIIFTKKDWQKILQILDVAVVPMTLGLALGRVGNWVNQEIYVSQAAHLGAVLKNLTIAAACYFFLKRYPQSKPGEATALFLVLYSVFRFISEYWRTQLWPEMWGLTRGQILTLPLFLFGLGLLLWIRKKN